MPQKTFLSTAGLFLLLFFLKEENGVSSSYVFYILKTVLMIEEDKEGKTGKNVEREREKKKLQSSYLFFSPGVEAGLDFDRWEECERGGAGRTTPGPTRPTVLRAWGTFFWDWDVDRETEELACVCVCKIINGPLRLCFLSLICCSAQFSKCLHLNATRAHLQ